MQVLDLLMKRRRERMQLHAMLVELVSEGIAPYEELIELANGGYGYLPPPNQHELGGYETWLGTSRFLPNASPLLTRNLLEMLMELQKVN